MPPVTIKELRPRDEVKPKWWITCLSCGVKFLQLPLVVLGYVLKLAWNAFRFGWNKA